MLTLPNSLLKQEYLACVFDQIIVKIMVVLFVVCLSFFFLLLFNSCVSARDSYSTPHRGCTFCSSTYSQPQTPPSGWGVPPKAQQYHLHPLWQFIPMGEADCAAFHCCVKETASAFIFVRDLLYPSRASLSVCHALCQTCLRLTHAFQHLAGFLALQGVTRHQNLKL